MIRPQIVGWREIRLQDFLPLGVKPSAPPPYYERWISVTGFTKLILLELR
ncbi:MAG: hypothetical protein HXY43_23640 [Fischerella sp.]|nr:hypothetical protein [Fischerella sp.]NWF62166.1 hypothetical protein [Fischerella sp.]